MINVAKVNIANTFPFIAVYLVVLAKVLAQLNTLNNSRSSAMGNLAAFTEPDIFDGGDEHWKIVYGDGISNGAVDNATGTAGVIELARAFAAADKKFKRSLVFN